MRFYCGSARATAVVGRNTGATRCSSGNTSASEGNKRERQVRKFIWNWNEWHAFSVGFCEVLCPWRPRIPVSSAQIGYIHEEYHYYLFGRAIGLIALVGVAKIIQVGFF